MKKVLSFLAIAVMTASCVNLNGTLEVSETLKAKKKGGFLNLQLKDVTIQPGSYVSELKVNSKSSFTLKLKSSKEDEADISLPIKSLEENFDIPQNGPISIKGEKVSQPFDLAGTITTSYSDSSTYRDVESCSVTVRENVCEKVCIEKDAKDPNKCVKGEVVCSMQDVYYNGHQNVEYHFLYTTRNLKADILAEKSDKVLATFNGSGTESDRIYDYKGPCYDLHR